MLITKFNSFVLFIIFSPIVKATSYRLPSNTAPRLYTINIEPHIEDVEFTSDGTSSVLFEVLEPTHTVTLHASEQIEIDKTYTSLIYENGTIFKPAEQKWDSIHEFFNLNFNHSLNVGNYTVKFKWRGHHSRNLSGFYRATNFDKNGHPEYTVATSFKPTSARVAFPCWDEPALKAEFEISLKHWPNYTALSNMPVKRKVSDKDGKIWTSFERSPKMSTYLVAFFVTTYERHVNQYGNITLYAHRDNYNEAKVVFDFTQKIVSAMENYTGIPYSLPKMDQFLISEYSDTESWGLIGYTPLVLYSPETDRIYWKNYAVRLSARQIVHQWFGNLVTPAWWSDVWLSEAFAAYFQFKVPDMILGNSHEMDFFVTDYITYAALIAQRFSYGKHPIKWVPDSPQKIPEIFSLVTYGQGAAVLYMLEHIITPEVFQSGLRTYLNKYQFNTATTDDLWETLQSSYDKRQITPRLNIKSIMDPWLEQTGYPMVNVTRDYKTGYITVTQINALDVNSKNRWMIPINFATRSQPNFESTRPTHWLQPSNQSLMLYNDVNKNDWIILNVQQTGFYRVNYDHENWRKIAEYLNSDEYKNIHVLNRAQLLRDILYTANREPGYWELVVDMISYLHRETSCNPWAIVSKYIPAHSGMLSNTNSYDYFARMMLYLANNFIRRIGVEIREDVGGACEAAMEDLLPQVCAFGHEGCRAVARRKFAEILVNNATTKRMPYITQRMIYCYGLMAANETVWDQFINVHSANNDLLGYHFLGCSEDHNLMKKYLDIALYKNFTDSSNPMSSGLHSILGGTEKDVDFALDYFIHNIDAILEYSTRRYHSKEIIYDIIWAFGKSIKSRRQYEKLATFLDKQVTDGKLDPRHYTITQLRYVVEFNTEWSETFNSIIKKARFLPDFIYNPNKYTK